jgi:subtilisin family serine protease
MHMPRKAWKTLAAAILLLIPAAPGAAAGDPFRSKQWALDLIGAPGAWTRTRGEGVTIAIVDSGVDLAHEDLKANIVPGINLVERGASPSDDNGHGTHVAGIAAAAMGNDLGMAGVAPAAKIMPVRVLANDCGGSEGGSCPASGSSTDIVAGIHWAVDHGAQVINLSLGEDALYRNIFGSEIGDGLEYAWQHGAIPVIAAGNQSLFPSGYSGVHAIVVVATDRDDELASYSSSSGLLGGATWGLAAPGGAGAGNENDILSTYWQKGKANSYGFLAGTSMAVPHVSAAAALLRSLGYSPEQAVDRLLQTAKDLGSPGPDASYGSGRIDIARAVDGLGRTLTPVPSPAKAPVVQAARRPAATPRPSAAPVTAATAVPTVATLATPETSAAPVPDAAAEVHAATATRTRSRGGLRVLPFAAVTLAMAGAVAAGFVLKRRAR